MNGWACPRCRGACNCSNCRKVRGCPAPLDEYLTVGRALLNTTMVDRVHAYLLKRARATHRLRWVATRVLNGICRRPEGVCGVSSCGRRQSRADAVLADSMQRTPAVSSRRFAEPLMTCVCLSDRKRAWRPPASWPTCRAPPDLAASATSSPGCAVSAAVVTQQSPWHLPNVVLTWKADSPCSPGREEVAKACCFLKCCSVLRERQPCFRPQQLTFLRVRFACCSRSSET